MQQQTFFKRARDIQISYLRFMPLPVTIDSAVPLLQPVWIVRQIKMNQVKAMAIDVEAYGGHVSTLNLRGLIQAKRAAGRAKDLLVLPELESLLEAEEP